MMYNPHSTRYNYPEYTDQHYLVVKKNNGLVFDENYPYIDNSKGFRFKRWWVLVLLYLIVFPLSIPYMGLRIKGRKNLKKYKSELSDGVITVSNHVHMWDYIAIMAAISPKKPNVVVWGPNVSGENGKMIRSVGGIPIPEHDLKASASFLHAIKDLLDHKHWLHVYSEGAMWEYYQPIRPFKHGASYFAIKNDKPILPLSFSYRKPGWFRKFFFHQIAKFTLHIGEPIYPDPSLSGGEQENDLTVKTHDAVCLLAGIDPKDNLYPPIYHNDKRIDYYTDVYGIGDKGSW